VEVKATGAVDTTFDPGAGANGEVFSVKLTEDGRLVITGSFTEYDGVKGNGSMRLPADGKPDTGVSPSTLAVKSTVTVSATGITSCVQISDPE